MGSPEIPDDIADIAEALVDAMRVSPEITFAGVARMIAEALAAERARCGKYATDQAKREPHGYCRAVAYLIADNIMGAK